MELSSPSCLPLGHWFFPSSVNVNNVHLVDEATLLVMATAMPFRTVNPDAYAYSRWAAAQCRDVHRLLQRRGL